MKKIIISIENCQKCNTLKSMAPEADCVLLDPRDLLSFARAVGIQSMPFVVTIGEPQELVKDLKGEQNDK